METCSRWIIDSVHLIWFWKSWLRLKRAENFIIIENEFHANILYISILEVMTKRQIKHTPASHPQILDASGKHEDPQGDPKDRNGFPNPEEKYPKFFVNPEFPGVSLSFVEIPKISSEFPKFS